MEDIDNPSEKDKLLENAYKKDEVCWGRKIKFAPDIILNFKDEGYFSESGYKSYTAKNFDNHRHKANHRKEGIFIIHGQGINQNKELVNINVYDVAPTVLGILGYNIPKDYDGKIIKEAFISNWYKENYTEPVYKKNIDKLSYSESEEKKVSKMLKDLGYI